MKTAPKMNPCRTAAMLLAAGILVISCSTGDRYISIQGYAQGGTYSVRLNLRGPDGMVRERPERIRQAIDSILNVIDTTLSGYNKGSLLSRFNAGEEIPLTPLFGEMYSRAYRYWEETDGALDAASAPLFDLWGFGFTSDSLPSAEKVEAVKALCGMGRLKRDIADAAPDAHGGDGTADMGMAVKRSEAGGEHGSRAAGNGAAAISAVKLLTARASAALPHKGRASAEMLPGDTADMPYSPASSPVKLNFNAIAQGYSCDAVAGYLHGIGVKDMLVDIGEIYCDGVNPSGRPWRVGVDRPVDGNETPGKDMDGIWESSGAPCGIVTSGNYRKFYIRDGKKYAHTIDPRTGWPVQHNLLSATIVARNATDADAYATYCMVIGLEAAQAFIESRADDIAGYLIYSDGHGEMHGWTSENFNLVKE